MKSVRENIMATREGSPANSSEDLDSDSEYEQGSETSDSDEISSEGSSNSSESEENSDDELNNTPERAALWTRVYPAETTLLFVILGCEICPLKNQVH